MRLSRYAYMLSVFLGLALLVSACTAPIDKTNSFRFVFMADIHVQPELNGDDGFRAAIAKVNSLQPKPDFVITGGDLVMDVLGQNFERADMLYTLYTDVCQDFTMPVYHCIGNHEVFGLYEKSGINPNHPEYGKRMFQNRLGEGETYRSFNHKGWHFIMLDGVGITEERKYIGEVDQKQLEWLSSDLAKVDKSTPVVVALHIPLVSINRQLKKGATAANSPSSVVTNSKSVMDAFIDNNLRLVLQGHLHIIEEIIYRDTHFITAGAVCGAWWKGPNEGFPEGFVVVDVQEDEFEWQYQTFGWNVSLPQKNTE